MDLTFIAQFGIVLCFGMGVLGSSMGVLAGGKAAAGAWAKDARAGKPIRFTYVIFIAAPMSQTLYSMIVMTQMKGVANLAANAGLLLGMGVVTGIGEMVSAWGQGIIGAAACRCLSEGDGKGFAFLVIAIGIIETAGIFTMVFMLGMIPR